MNLPLWTGIREYIAAEIALALAQRQLAEFRSKGETGEPIDCSERLVAKLAERSSAMETTVRELIEPASSRGDALREVGKGAAVKAGAEVAARKRGELPSHCGGQEKP